VQCSDSGSGGVFFCSAAKGSFVVKSTTHAAPEYFTNLLYRKLGINVPAMRVVQWSNGEYQRMVEEMKLCCYSEVKTKTKVRRELDRAYALLMEYIPGFSIMDIGPARLSAALNLPNSVSLLHQIGRIVAGDLLVNNSDRIPLVWHNNGNPNNLLFSLNPAVVTKTQLQDPQFTLQLEAVVAIDSRCYCIPQVDSISRRNYDSYLDRINTFLANLLRDLPDCIQNSSNIPALEPFLHFFRENCVLNLTFSQQFEILKGLFAGLKAVSSLQDTDLTDLLGEVQTLVTEDWMNIWQEELAHIRLEFLQSVRDLIKGHIASLSSILE